ncbi:MAG: DUF2275 domain-containing protein [Nitrospiraceae bacterium]|nr:MAG: DUF2275 domain-containing protein [Nitrospiraceae bacterium]
MDCRDIQEKLSAFMEEELSIGEMTQVEEHLKACPKCSLALEDLRKTIALTKSIEEAEPPPWLRQKVMTRVREEAAKKKGILQKLFYPLHIKVPLEVFATVAIAVTAFYVFNAVEPEITQPQPFTSPSVDIQESEKKDIPELAKVPAEKELLAVVPAPASQASEPEDRVPAAGMAEEAVSPPEKETVRLEESGAADFRMKREMRSLAPSVMMKAAEADKQAMGMTLFVKDTLTVSQDIEKAVRKLGGEIIRSESVDNKLFFTVILNSTKVKELKEAMKFLGEVVEETALPSAGGDVEIRLKVMNTELRLH